MRILLKWALMISFVVLVVSTVGLTTPWRHSFKGLHSASGWIFIVLTAVHVYLHRLSYKLKKKSKKLK